MTTPTPKISRKDGTTWIDLEDGAAPFRVVSWNPPRLLLARGDEVRSFFAAPTADGEGVWIGGDGRTERVDRPSRRRGATSGATAPGHEDLTSPMPGKILEVLVEEGEKVSAGQRLVVIEAMKMENPLRAPHDSVVTKIHVKADESIGPGDPIIELDAAEQ